MNIYCKKDFYDLNLSKIDSNVLSEILLYVHDRRKNIELSKRPYCYENSTILSEAMSDIFELTNKESRFRSCIKKSFYIAKEGYAHDYVWASSIMIFLIFNDFFEKKTGSRLAIPLIYNGGSGDVVVFLWANNMSEFILKIKINLDFNHCACFYKANDNPQIGGRFDYEFVKSVNDNWEEIDFNSFCFDSIMYKSKNTDV